MTLEDLEEPFVGGFSLDANECGVGAAAAQANDLRRTDKSVWTSAGVVMPLAVWKEPREGGSASIPLPEFGFSRPSEKEVLMEDMLL